jgi:hypothetical protein
MDCEEPLYAAVKEVSKYKLHSEGVQHVREDRGGTEPASECIFFYEKANNMCELGIGFLGI